MITKSQCKTMSQCKSIVNLAIEYAKTKDVEIEILITQNFDNNSRFANNHMTQNQNMDEVEISVRVIKGQKQAKYNVNQSSNDTIKFAIDEACRLLKLVPDNPAIMALPQAQTAVNIDRLDNTTANLTPLDRANTIEEVTHIAKQNNLMASGLYETGSNLIAIGNSNNLFQYFVQSNATFSLTMTCDNASGWMKGTGLNADKLDIINQAKHIAKNTLLAQNPCDIEPGHYTVILPAEAVSDLLGNLWWDFTATSFRDKRSCFLDKLHKQVLGKNVTIYDDVFNEMQIGQPFDDEGVNKKKVLLVKNGVLNSLVYNRLNAHFFKEEATGHSLPQPNVMGEYPANIVMEGGDSSIEDMIASTDRGILLTRVWYVREVDPTSKIVTGMTRDGTFLVENGKVTKAVKNLRFNESLLEMLNKIEMLGKAKLTQGEESNPVVVPPLKVAYFNFESVTKF